MNIGSRAHHASWALYTALAAVSATEKLGPAQQLGFAAHTVE
jgi:hypothetical protein